MTFTTFDLGGHEQGKGRLAELDTPSGVSPPISPRFSSHLKKNLPKRDAGES